MQLKLYFITFVKFVIKLNSSNKAISFFINYENKH